MINLVGNAIKFTERGGVRVVARVTGTRTAPQLAIDVIDTGIGIPADKLDKLFQPFVQADTSVTRKFGGTGLGLAISRNFARALGGDIVVKSEAGKGSTFTATIDTGPLAGVRMLDPAEAARVEEEVAADAQARWEFPARRILVVDDGPKNRELVTLVLAEAGLTTEEAENGQIAVDMAARTAYDVILMDMSMPVMDGYTATKLLRGRGSKVPIIALTAHAMKGFEQEILAAGCTGYVTKPIDIDVLLGTLAAKLGGRRVQGAPAARIAPVEEQPVCTVGVRRARRPGGIRSRGRLAGRVAARQSSAAALRGAQVCSAAGRAARRHGARAPGRKLPRARRARALAEGRRRDGGLRRLHRACAHPRELRQGRRRVRRAGRARRAARHGEADGGAGRGGRSGGMSSASGTRRFAHRGPGPGPNHARMTRA